MRESEERGSFRCNFSSISQFYKQLEESGNNDIENGKYIELSFCCIDSFTEDLSTCTTSTEVGIANVTAFPYFAEDEIIKEPIYIPPPSEPITQNETLAPLVDLTSPPSKPLVSQSTLVDSSLLETTNEEDTEILKELDELNLDDVDMSVSRIVDQIIVAAK